MSAQLGGDSDDIVCRTTGVSAAEDFASGSGMVVPGLDGCGSPVCVFVGFGSFVGSGVEFDAGTSVFSPPGFVVGWAGFVGSVADVSGLSGAEGTLLSGADGPAVGSFG